MLVRPRRRHPFANIPPNLDVLVTHSPPFGCLDLTYGGEHIGCPELRQEVYRKKPTLHFFGHCHEGARREKQTSLGHSTLFNVAHYTKRGDVARVWHISDKNVG